MNLSSLTERIDSIIAVGDDDPEMAHGDEDDLMTEWIMGHASPEELAEFDRLWNAQFPRWGA